jgi:integrase
VGVRPCPVTAGKIVGIFVGIGDKTPGETQQDPNALPLTDTQIRSIKPADTMRKFSDGGGLHLFVPAKKADGTAPKLWRLAYRYHGKQKTLAMGVYPAVSLADAREKRTAAKKLLSQGIDPSQQAKADKAAKRQAHALTFDAVADEFLAKTGKEGRADNTLDKKKWLLGHARPSLGKRPISEIKAADILPVLRKIEAAGKYDTARRVRSNIGQVFRLAVSTGRAEYDPTTNLKGALTAVPPTHRAALTDRKAFGGLLRAAWGYEGAAVVRSALMLMAYLYPRPGELRFARVDEFDLDKAVWTIPPSRTKTRREHTKPLPRQALDIIRALPRHAATPLLLPGVVSPHRALSENTLNAALRRMGITRDEATAHGFRASASSLLNESGLWNPDAIEAELAHVGADEVRRAYHRSKYWEERVRMAAWWADEVDRMRAT